MNTIIQGKTVDLKIIDESDIEQLREWRNSNYVSDFMISRTFISKDQQEQWYNTIKNDPSGIYWVIFSKEGVKLGLASLTKIDRINNEAEPGLYIGTKTHRNSFYGMEAYYYILDYGFQQIGLEKIFGTVISSNKTAIKMNSSFGFVTNTVLKAEIVVNGIPQDIYKVVLSKKAFYESKMVKFFSIK